jgi:undecaprenyl-diphosphatase
LITKTNGKKTEKDMNYKDALYVGFMQVFALIPGISRSGITLSSGMFRNLKKEVALKYSFMLYIPISIATMILGMSDFVSSSSFSDLWLSYLLGMIASTIVTYFTFKWFRNILLKDKIKYFVIYCFIAGLIALLVL